MKDKIRRVLAMREGGDVMRCHVQRYIGSYTNGSHSFNAACLLLALNPQCTKELLQAVLMHDLAERWVGDMPAPAKWYNEKLGGEYESAEARVMRHWDIPMPTSLNSLELMWLDAVDKIELYLWIEDQRALGNRNLDWVQNELLVYFRSRAGKWPPEAIDFVEAFKWERLPEYEKEKKHHV